MMENMLFGMEKYLNRGVYNRNHEGKRKIGRWESESCVEM
jgi:hypothetical protein